MKKIFVKNKIFTYHKTYVNKIERSLVEALSIRIYNL